MLDNSYNGSNDFYVCRMDIDQNFLAGTYVGGTGNEVNMMGLNTDQNNDVFVFGYSSSTNFPVTALPNTALQSTNQGQNDKVFFKLETDLSALVFSTYYGGTTNDYDPVGERGIKFSNCRIYTIVTAQSNNIPLTQGALNTTKNSPTTRYEPGLVVWANPPDLLGNTITGTRPYAQALFRGHHRFVPKLCAADDRAQQRGERLSFAPFHGHLPVADQHGQRELERHLRRDRSEPPGFTDRCGEQLRPLSVASSVVMRASLPAPPTRW